MKQMDVLTLYPSVLMQEQQWVVPIYQRRYEWETDKGKKQIPGLWEDLKDRANELLAGRDLQPHYVGSMIYAQPVLSGVGEVPQHYIVDGQQRLTTFQLIFAALREVARTNGDQENVVKLDRYIFNQQYADMKDASRGKFKLWSSHSDRPLFQELMESTADQIQAKYQEWCLAKSKVPKNGAPKMIRAYWYFYMSLCDFMKSEENEAHYSGEILSALIKGFLQGFKVVTIRLDQDDNAQAIFASLNGQSEPLKPFDLIRNDVFIRAHEEGPETGEELFEKHWKQFEDNFWNEKIRSGRDKSATHADRMIFHTITAEMAEEIRITNLPVEYRRYATQGQKFSTVQDEITSLLEHAEIYRRISEASSQDEIWKIARVLKLWDMSTENPLVIWTCKHIEDVGERQFIFDMLESYTIRREICGYTTAGKNKLIPRIIREMKKAADGGVSPIKGFKQYVSGLKSRATKMPTDKEFADGIGRKPVYKKIRKVQKLHYIYEQLEYAMRSEFSESSSICLDNIGIEHIMPQKWAKHWPLPNGNHVQFVTVEEAEAEGVKLDMSTREAVRRRGELIDTMGNLTIVTDKLNASVQNGPWGSKRDKIQANSALFLNKDLTEHEEHGNWTEGSIKKRSEKIAECAIKRWPSIKP